MLLLFTLLVVYQIKHFIADYPLQTPYMLKKFLPGNAWILPLTAHAGVHAVMTGAIAATVLSYENGHWALPLAILDFGIHFVMDRIKASPDLLGKYQAVSKNQMEHIILDRKKGINWEQNEKVLKSNKYFWWALGLDQMVHHLTHYLLIYLMLQGV